MVCGKLGVGTLWVVMFSIFHEEMHWSLISERAVGTLVVIYPHPGLAHRSRLPKIVKGISVKDFFTKGSIEPFNVSILMRLAFLNEDDLNSMVVGPVGKRLRNEF